MPKQPLWTRHQINAELKLWDQKPLKKSEWDEVRYDLEHFTADQVAQTVMKWRQRRQVDGAPEVSASDVMRFTYARSLLNAAMADEDTAVQKFRADVLGGQLLDLREVEGWINRQHELDGPPTRWVIVPAPPGWRRGDPLTDTTRHAGTAVQLDYSTAAQDAEHCIGVAHGGILDRLQQLSTSLAERFQWRPAQATVYTLTGRTPLVSMLRVSQSIGGSSQRITISADPDVPTELVASAFKRARANLIGPRARRPFARGIELVVHAAERPGLDNRSLWHQWNREHPDDQYLSPRAFRQALSDATRRVSAQTWPVRGDLP